jgi:hypothetical protein
MRTELDELNEQRNQRKSSPTKKDELSRTMAPRYHINTHTGLLLLLPLLVYNGSMTRARFEWDEAKDLENIAKHGISFETAQRAFLDPCRVIAEDIDHSRSESRFYCIGRIGEGVVTVRFTYRGGVIRIFGAGYWRKGKRIYEAQNQVQ